MSSRVAELREFCRSSTVVAKCYSIDTWLYLAFRHLGDWKSSNFNTLLRYLLVLVFFFYYFSGFRKLFPVHDLIVSVY